MRRDGYRLCAGQRGWSAFADIAHLATSDRTERALLTIDADNKKTFIGAVAAYWPGGVDSALSLFGGSRYSGFKDKQAEYRDGDLKTEFQYAGPMAGFNFRF